MNASISKSAILFMMNLPLETTVCNYHIPLSSIIINMHRMTSVAKCVGLWRPCWKACTERAVQRLFVFLFLLKLRGNIDIYYFCFIKMISKTNKIIDNTHPERLLYLFCNQLKYHVRDTELLWYSMNLGFLSLIKSCTE